MFHYEQLFAPYTLDGATLENSISWLKKSVDVDDRIISEVINDTMSLLSHGEKFLLPCPCGCGLTNVHTPINHYMLARACDLKNQTEKAFIDVLKKNEKTRLEARQKLLSDFDEKYDKMINGSWADQHLPTFKKLLRLE